MSNVKVCKKHEVEFCGQRPCDICVMEAKCADYERLRDALEKLQDGFTPGDWIWDVAHEALNPPPAAGDARENDGTVAARKDKESDL